VNFAAMRNELAARGFDDISTARLGYYVNAGLRDVSVYNGNIWPWDITTTTGTAPLTIAGLRNVLMVLDTTNNHELQAADVDALRAGDPTLTLSDVPFYWYMDGTSLGVYPNPGGVGLSVRYAALPTALSGDADTPAAPSIFHDLIVDAAVLRAYRDQDAWDLSNNAAQQWRSDMDAMAASIFPVNQTVYPDRQTVLLTFDDG
jgi:hypothetical protein